MQNETSAQADAAALAAARGLRVIYSAAPFDLAAVQAVLPHVGLLVMNEGEAAELRAGLGALPGCDCLITQGARGAEWLSVAGAAAQVRLLDRKYGVDSEITKAALVDSLDRRGIVRWDEFAYSGPSLDKVENSHAAAAGARFGTIDAPLNDSKLMTALRKDFTDWIFRNSE